MVAFNTVTRWFTAIALVVAVAGPVTLCGSPAFAQTEQDKANAREHYKRATVFFDVGRYDDAILAYERAYLLTKDPAMLYNVAQCHRLAERWEEAARMYANYLRRRPNASNRQSVEKKIAAMKEAAEAETSAKSAEPIPVVPAKPDDRLTGNVDARPRSPTQTTPATTSGPLGTTAPALGREPPPQATAAPVTVPRMAPRTAPRSATGDGMAYRETSSSAVSGRPDIAKTAPATMHGDGARPGWLLWTVAGAGVAAVASAAYFGAVGANRAKTLEDAAGNNEPFDPDIESQGKNANLGAYISGVAGLGFMAWGTYLWFTADRSAGGVSTQASKGGEGRLVANRRAQAVFVPIVSPEHVGGRLSWRF